MVIVVVELIEPGVDHRDLVLIDGAPLVEPGTCRPRVELLVRYAEVHGESGIGCGRADRWHGSGDIAPGDLHDSEWTRDPQLEWCIVVHVDVVGHQRTGRQRREALSEITGEPADSG